MKDFLNRLGNLLKWSSFACLVTTIIFFVFGAVSANRMEFYASYTENRYLDSEGDYDVSRDVVSKEWWAWTDAQIAKGVPDDFPIDFDLWLESRVAKYRETWLLSYNVATYTISYWLLTILIQYLWLGSVWLPFRKTPEVDD